MAVDWGLRGRAGHGLVGGGVALLIELRTGRGACWGWMGMCGLDLNVLLELGELWVVGHVVGWRSGVCERKIGGGLRETVWRG